MSLPISVIVPHIGSRAWSLPLVVSHIQANDPTEILIVGEEGGRSACEKRNAGFAKVTQPYVFFCDDDVILSPNALARLLVQYPAGSSYAYGDYAYINHPRRGSGIHHAGPFDEARLLQANFVSTMSLIWAADFPLFDITLPRLQDYDLWLTMLEQGHTGHYVEGPPLFATWYAGDTITQAVGFDEAMARVHAKHGIG